MSRTTLVRGTVTIDVEQCKGCELCIPACPPGVLVMSRDVNSSGYRFPLLMVGCTGCRACREVCPDFVFDVFKFDVPLEVAVVEPAGAEPEDADRLGTDVPIMEL